jgi:RND superfamily putative drug exporter
MGNKLHQIGASFYRHPWRVIAAWIMILGMLGGIAATQYKQPTSAITIPGVAGANAMDRMKNYFPKLAAARRAS